MLRFRLFGIPFEVGIDFWIFSAILGGSGAHGPNAVLLLAVWVACVFVSIVVHELGHALTARRFGAFPVVRLYSLGGVTQPGRGFPRGQELLMVLGGPAAGLALYLAVRAFTYLLVNFVPGAIPFFVSDTPVNIAAVRALYYLLFINLYWTLFNLLPILPLDGGLILGNVLGPGRLALARIVGAVCAAGCAVWAYFAGQYYMVLFCGLLAFQNFQGVASPRGGGR